jgi:hypothetical protein
MPRIRICAVLVALLVLNYAVAHSQTLVLQQNKCDLGKVGEIRAFVDSAFAPVAQELVNEGKIMGFHSAFHAWGDEWNVVYFYVAESIPRSHADDAGLVLRAQRQLLSHGEDDRAPASTEPLGLPRN